MLWAIRIGMLVFGLAVAGLAVTGIVSLVRRRWARGFWLGLGASAGSGAMFGTIWFLALVYTRFVLAGSALPVTEKARLLGETISTAMNWGSPGLFAFPVGIVIAVVGAVGWSRHRTPRATDS